jgi:hypothetical protein
MELGSLSRVYILRLPVAFGVSYHSSYNVHCHPYRFHQTLKSDSSFNLSIFQIFNLVLLKRILYRDGCYS